MARASQALFSTLPTIGNAKKARPEKRALLFQ
jgi:hypothetical protein